MQCQINHLKLVQFSGKDTFSNNFQDMWFNKIKKKFSGSYMVIMKLFAWGYCLIYIFYLISPTLLPIWIHHSILLTICFYLYLVSRMWTNTECFPRWKTKTLETNESPGAKARCSFLEFNTVMESKHMRRDLSEQPQGHNFQFRESPKRGFQN